MIHSAVGWQRATVGRRFHTPSYRKIIVTTLRAPQPAAVRTGQRAAYTAWAWVVVFTCFHVYWFLGGGFGLAGDLPEASPDLWSVTVWAVFAAGLVVPLAAAQSWGQRIPRWMLLAALWIGFAVLTLRGLAGIVDDLLRVSGSATGLTGLSIEQVFGTANPSTVDRWTGRITDWYFALGGLLFAWAAIAYGTRQRPPAVTDEQPADARRC